MLIAKYEGYTTMSSKVVAQSSFEKCFKIFAVFDEWTRSNLVFRTKNNLINSLF